MRTNEIKEIVEKVVRVEYIAEDGEVFRNEEECKKYEESALFAISKQLKRLTTENIISQNDINDILSVDDMVEIFDIQTEKDLENLRRYLYLKAKKNGASESSIKSCFTTENDNGNDFVFNNVTLGHEVIIFWNYEEDGFWVYRDGSINGYCEFFRDKITKLITPEVKEN